MLHALQQCKGSPTAHKPRILQLIRVLAPKRYLTSTVSYLLVSVSVSLWMSFYDVDISVKYSPSRLVRFNLWIHTCMVTIRSEGREDGSVTTPVVEFSLAWFLLYENAAVPFSSTLNARTFCHTTEMYCFHLDRFHARQAQQYYLSRPLTNQYYEECTFLQHPSIVLLIARCCWEGAVVLALHNVSNGSNTWSPDIWMLQDYVFVFPLLWNSTWVFASPL